MVDGVNFNPFANRIFTAEEIEKCDTDKNGVISNEELQANASWLSTVAGVDEEGDVQIGGGESAPEVVLSSNEAKIYSAAAKNGVQDTAADASQLQQYMNTIIDSYIEQYMQKNPGLDQNQKNSLITFIKSQGEEFVNSYLQNNTAVPYNTQSVAQSLIQTLDSAVQQRNDLATDVNNQINDLKNNVDANYDKLSSTTNAADDDYVTSAEFQQMKEEAIAYLMGTLLNGAEDAEFLAGLNPNYKNDSNYKIAMAAINSINNETDPAKIQEYLEQAKNALSNLIGTQNVDGTSKLNNTVISSDTSKAEAEKAAKQAEYTETLTGVVDSMVELYSNTKTRRGIFSKKTPSEDQVQQYQTLLTNVMNKFVESYDGDGKNLEAEFKNYVTQVLQESAIAQANLADLGETESSAKYGELKDAVNNVGSYVSAEEKQNIVNVATDFVLNQLAQGIGDISILEEIYPNYSMDAKFVEAQSLISGLATSATPNEDLDKAKQLIAEMMETIGADAISEGVKNKKMPAVTLSEESRDAVTSSVPGYDNNESISTGRYRDRGDALNDIQNQAKERLEALRPTLLAQLKAQMGADYDEAALNELIDDAIYQTINDFTDMRVDKNGKHYTTDDPGFVTSKSGRKSRGVVNVRQLVDAFLAKFEELSAASVAEQDPNKNPVTTEDLMLDTELADKYQDKSTTFRFSRTRVKDQAKAQIKIAAAGLKAKLAAALGADYDSSKINEMIEQATTATLDSITGHSFNTRSLVDKFMEEFNKLYEASNSSSSS